MPITSDSIQQQLQASFAAANANEQPYPHWFLESCLPEDAVAATCALPFEAPALDGLSGRREVHNATRKYFDTENRAKFPVVEAVSQAFQTPEMTRKIEQTFPTSLTGCYLRIEFAQDVDGFWLEPHTDLGVKLFTMLLYLSDGPGHDQLGTDIYDADQKHVGRSPFARNAAMVFIPSDITYHGFEARPIHGVRKSLVINYVSDEWRAREQLAFPDSPIGA